MNKPLITLYLGGYPIQRPGSKTTCSFEDPQDYNASVRLVVDQLNDKGYVTDNLPFIEQTASISAQEAPDKVASIIVEHARNVIGSSLIKVEAGIQQSNATVGRKVWEHPHRQVLPRCCDIGQSKSVKSDVMVPVNLVDLSVCGGYNGQFRCDFELVLPSEVHAEMGRLVDRASKAFAGGPYKASCEELTEGLAHVAIQIYGDDLQCMITRVYNKTGYAECDWRVGDDLPNFPRLATLREIEESEERKRNPQTAPGPC